MSAFRQRLHRDPYRTLRGQESDVRAIRARRHLNPVQGVQSHSIDDQGAGTDDKGATPEGVRQFGWLQVMPDHLNVSCLERSPFSRQPEADRVAARKREFRREAGSPEALALSTYRRCVSAQQRGDVGSQFRAGRDFGFSD